MKSIRMIGVFLLVFLFSVSSVYALKMERKGASIIITNRNPQIELVLSKRARVLSFDLKTAQVTLHLSQSVEKEDGLMFIRCTSNSTNEVVTFSDREYEIISLLMTSLDFSRRDEDYSQFCYSSLNILESWPANLFVFVVIDPEKILYYQSDGTLGVLPGRESITPEGYVCPPGKELNFPAPECENLCSKKGELVTGDILHLGDWTMVGVTATREAWTEPFDQYVGIGGTEDINGPDSCFGRCGKGCPEDFSGRITYTQCCFNHDGCVQQHGYFAENCNTMFFYCMYDYAYAPICYEIWVSTYN